jgi:predicted DNA-binding transcriptional regulator AlpA
MRNQHFTITEVEVQAPSRLQLTFADSERMQVDLSRIISDYRTLAPLADSKVFETAEVGDWGGCIVWNNDDNLELAADNLRARAIEQAGGFSHERIWNWMTKNQLTLDTAANELGLSRRMLAYYRSGEKPVPRTVGLAIVGWETLHKPKPVHPAHKVKQEVMVTVNRELKYGKYFYLHKKAVLEKPHAARGGSPLITAKGPTKPARTSSKKTA